MTEEELSLFLPALKGELCRYLARLCSRLDPPFSGKLADPGPVKGPGGLIHVSVNSCRIFSEDLLHCACLFQNGSIRPYQEYS